MTDIDPRITAAEARRAAAEQESTSAKSALAEAINVVGAEHLAAAGILVGQQFGAGVIAHWRSCSWEVGNTFHLEPWGKVDGRLKVVCWALKKDGSRHAAIAPWRVSIVALGRALKLQEQP